MWAKYLLPKQKARKSKAVVSAGKKEKQYRIIKRLGRGAFGTVYQARHKLTNQILAIKETLQDPRFVNREGDISKMMDHENVIKFHDISYEYRNSKKYLILVMEYYPQSLQDLINTTTNIRQRLANGVFQNIAISIFRGLSHIHAQQIAHRDIKPDNILINVYQGKVAIADLGSAKPIHDGSYNKSYICSRIYRAPELVLGCQKYTYRIDVWSTGCVLLELLLLTPLFPAQSNEHLLELMQKLLGKLNKDEIAKLKEGNLEGEPIEVQNKSVMKKIAAHCGNRMTPQLMDLISQTLQWDPQARIHADMAVKHPFFSSLNV